jgi:lactoylglutathione lyase
MWRSVFLANLAAVLGSSYVFVSVLGVKYLLQQVLCLSPDWAIPLAAVASVGLILVFSGGMALREAWTRAVESSASDGFAATPRPALLPRLSLLVIRSADPARLARFYTGLGLRFEAERHKGGPVHYVSQDSGFVFEIYPDRAGTAGGGERRLGFGTASFDTVLSALRIEGGRIVNEPRATASGRHTVLLDPDGHTVELSETA